MREPVKNIKRKTSIECKRSAMRPTTITKERKKSTKNDKFISYPLLNSNLIFFCSEFVSLCVCKNVQTIGRDRMYSTHCTSVKITLKIRAVKIFVFVCKVAAKKNAGNIKSVCCKQNMSRERAKRSVFFHWLCAAFIYFRM